MVEKFSDYDGGFIAEEGDFIFTIKDAELVDSKKGNLMVKFDVQADEGKTTVYHSLDTKSRWSYNKLIAACLKLTREERRAFELDYETIHNQLIGKQFVGTVEAQTYDKEVKKPMDDGTYLTEVQTKEGYKIVEYAPVE